MDGRWRWRADRADGEGGRIHVWHGWATRDEAGEIVRGLLAESTPQPAGEIETVRDLLECWIGAVRARRDVSPRTRLSCEGAARRLLEHGLGTARVEILGRREIERHRDAALGDGAGGATVARDLKYLRQAHRWAMEAGEIPARLLSTRRSRSAGESASDAEREYSQGEEHTGGTGRRR